MALTPSDLVVEVGPGHGVLTQALARSAGRVIAVELDPALAHEVAQRFEGDPRVQVVGGDFLRFPIPHGARVVANLPFAITADAVRHVVTSQATEAHLVVQREAAERFAGSPWGGETLPSLSLKPWWHIEVTRALARTDFDPPPSVDCAVLWLARRSPALLRDEERSVYERFLAATFGRGRTTGQVLGRVFTRGQLERLRRDLHLDLGAPPSATSFDRWLALYRAANVLGRLPGGEVRRERR